MGPAQRVPWSYWLEQLQNTEINTTVRAFQTRFWSCMPHCAGPVISAFSNLYKHNSRCYCSYYSIVITGTQHGRHGVSNQRSFNWFRQWLGAEQATSHHLNKWDLHTLSLETYSFVTSKLCCYYSDATWASCFQLPVARLFVQWHVLANNKANLHTLSFEM